MRYTNKDILDALTDAIEADGSMRNFARRVGIEAAYISEVCRGIKPPSPRLAEALGFIDDGKRWVRQKARAHDRPQAAA